MSFAAKQISDPVREWRRFHLGTVALAAAYAQTGNVRRAARCLGCAEVLQLDEDGQLVRANLCGDRLCPTCEWRRSRRLALAAEAVVRAAEADKPGNKFVHVTFTKKNVSGEELSPTVASMLRGFSLLSKSSVFRTVDGWLRRIEITFNAQEETWHPHVHALLFVQPGYFDGSKYVTMDKWRDAWGRVMHLDYQPNVRAVRVTDAAQVGKYLAKRSRFVDDASPGALPGLVATLVPALGGRHLTATGGALRGLWRTIPRETKREPSCVMTYRWQDGNYVAA